VTSPFGPMVVIANPRSGRGKAGKKLGEVERILRDEGLDYRIVRTTHPGHATKIARAALEGGERYLVAAGGDGTVHEVVNGMLQDGQPVAAEAVLGVVASGSGCDFVRSFGLPGDAAQAAHHLAGDAVRNIDCFYGGGMQISPRSEPDDGVLDVLVMAGPKSDAFTLLPKIYRGSHLPHPNIVELQAGRVRIETDPPFQVEADGETLGTTPATFEVIRNPIRLKV